MERKAANRARAVTRDETRQDPSPNLAWASLPSLMQVTSTAPLHNSDFIAHYCSITSISIDIITVSCRSHACNSLLLLPPISSWRSASRRQHAALSKFLPTEPAAQSACDSGATGPWYVIILSAHSLAIHSQLHFTRVEPPATARTRARPTCPSPSASCRAINTTPPQTWTVAAAACSSTRLRPHIAAK